MKQCSTCGETYEGQKTCPCPVRKPEPVAQVSARMKRYRERLSKERRLNREHLRAHGFDGDPEKFVTQWRAGKIRVTFEVIKKGE